MGEDRSRSWGRTFSRHTGPRPAAPLWTNPYAFAGKAAQRRHQSTGIVDREGGGTGDPTLGGGVDCELVAVGTGLLGTRLVRTAAQAAWIGESSSSSLGGCA